MRAGTQTPTDPIAALRERLGTDKKRRHLEFSDCRAGKVVLVPHCVLNQNARVAGAAEKPAAVAALIEGLLERRIGVVQMPCPELQLLGLDRANLPIRQLLSTSIGRAACRQLARDTVYQIEQYRACGVQVLGILGKDGSPSCGVEITWEEGLTAGSGIFIEVLCEELRRAGIDLSVRGMTDGEPDAALRILDRWVSRRPLRRSLATGDPVKPG
jgi:predicted secreted protein